jgi:hypothetical protein
VRRRLAIGAAATAVAAAVAIPLGVTSGGSIDVFVGGTPTPSPLTCDRTATTATFSTQIAAATGGQTLCLAAGTYTTPTLNSTNASKSSTVTIRPDSGVTIDQVRVTPTITTASNLTFSDVTIIGGSFNSDPTNVDIRDSRIVEQVLQLRTDGMSNTGIDIDGNYIGDCYVPQKTGDTGGQGTLYFPVAGTVADGITVSHNVISNEGLSDHDWACDGILNGGNGTAITDNEFRGFVQSACGTCQHTDPIQLFGSKNTVISRNWFHDNDVASSIMAPDDLDHETIADNVIDKTGSSDPRTLNLGGDVGSTVTHNTLIGSLNLKWDKDNVPSTGTVVRDNIITGGMSRDAGGDTSAPATYANNLVGTACGYCTGSGNITGNPVFTGGSTLPFASRTSYALTSGSPGKGAASDGADIGAP